MKAKFLTDANIEEALKGKHIGGVYVTPQRYGAKGDGVTDDTAAINECLAENSLVYIPNGTYLIDAAIGVKPKSNQVIQLDAHAVLKGHTETTTVDGNAVGSWATVQCASTENVVICGGNIVGDRADDEDGSGDDIRHGITIINCKNVTVDGCRIYAHRGDGIIVSASGEEADYATNIVTNTKIVNCEIYDCSRHGMFVDGLDGLLVKDTEIHDCNTFAYSCAIDLEIHYDWHTIHNVRLEGVKSYNTSLGIQYGYFATDGALSGFEVEGCDLDRITCPTTTTVKNSTIFTFVCNRAPEVNVLNCRITYVIFNAAANICNFYNCVFGGESAKDYYQILAGESGDVDESNLQIDCVGCTFLTRSIDDVRDYSKCVMVFNAGIKRACFDGCSFFVRNPNGVCGQGFVAGSEEVSFTNCYFKVKHGYPSYGGWVLILGGKCELVNNIFDTSEALSSDKYVVALKADCSATMIHNTVLGNAYLGVISNEGTGSLTCIGNVFRAYTDRWAFGKEVDGFVIDKIGNITSDTTAESGESA